METNDSDEIVVDSSSPKREATEAIEVIEVIENRFESTSLVLVLFIRFYL